jgi:hypothetical protein
MTKGFEHALQQRHRDHVAVGDVAHFVAQHGFGFVAVHGAQQARGHGDERLVAVGAGGEGIDFRGVVDRDFRHADAGGLRLRLTVSYSQRSVSLRGWSITCAPVVRLAIHLEISSEMMDPPNPKTAAKSRSPAKDCGLIPRTDMITLSSASTARLVARNSTRAFEHVASIPGHGGCGHGSRVWWIAFEFKTTAP